MTLVPLLDAPLTIQLHAAAAAGALALSAHQLLGPKGGPAHRVLGALRAALMMGVAVSSFWIGTIRQFGAFSLLHLLSLLTIVMVPAALWAAHRHDAVRHRRIMLNLFWMALVGAGAFTLAPGRVMHAAVFG